LHFRGFRISRSSYHALLLDKVHNVIFIIKAGVEPHPGALERFGRALRLVDFVNVVEQMGELGQLLGGLFAHMLVLDGRDLTSNHIEMILSEQVKVLRDLQALIPVLWTNALGGSGFRLFVVAVEVKSG